MNRKQLIYSILALFLLGLIVTGGTFAYLSWRSDNNKSVIFNTAKNLEKYIVYDEGDSKFIGDFKVSSTYTKGMHSTISLYKTSEAASVNLLATINMDVNSIGNYMKQSRAVKWTVTSGTSSNVGSVLAQGNFIGVNNGDTLTLVPNIEVTTTKTYYTVWLWIDSNLNPSDNLTGETLDTTVWTEISQVEGIEDKFEITRINANYQNINATVVNNKHKITAYAVTTSNTTPSSWTSISSTEQSNVYNLNHTVSQTGTYYVWFKSDDNKTVSRSVVVTSVDTTAPVCTWGTFTNDPIQNNTTSEIVLTCIDNESEITINNLKVDNIITSNSNITVTSIARATQSNGYKYTITVKGTANDGETTLTIPANTIKNAMGLGNEVKTSSAITVANTYTVKYQTGNSACSLNTNTYKDYEATYGTVFNIANPTCSGYTFQGWTANSGLDTTNAKYGTSSSAVTTTWSNASTKVTATWFNNLAKRDTKEVTLTANWSDSTKPVCTVSTPSSMSYGSMTTVTVTCTDNAAMSSQTLATSNFTSSNTGVATVQSVSNPTAVTNGYKYTVTMKGVGVGSYTLSINANAITDSTGNKNDKATSSNGTVTAKSLTPSINTCTSKTYDGKTNATCTLSLATIESGDTVTASGTCTFDNKNVGNNKTVSCSSISLSGTNASKYTLSSTSTSKTSAANITVFTPTVSLTAKSAAYTGSAINANTATVTLTNSETYSGTITYKYYSNNTCTTEVTTSNSGASATGAAPVKVGTWYAQASIAASGNYASAKSACVAHTITQKKGTITLTNSSVALTYKTSGSNTYTYDGDGTVSCSSSNTSYVTCSVDTTNHKINVVPVAKTSSAITITVSAGAGTNYSAADNKTFTVTVAAFTPTVSLTAKTDAQRTFTGSAIAANTATVTLTNSETYSGTITYTYYTNNACSTGATTTAPTYGTWYVKASIAASGNYNAASSGCVNHTIIAATPTVSLSAKTGMTYNGSSQTANTATVSPNGGGTITYTYYTNNACSAGATTTAPTNVGNYWVKASVAEVSGKTNAASSSCVAHTIAKKALTATQITAYSTTWVSGATTYSRSGVATGVGSETVTLTYTPYANSVGSYTYATSAASGKFTLSQSNTNYSISGAGNLTLSGATITGSVTISGTARWGQTLTANASCTTPSSGCTFESYQWYSNGTAISGATSSTYSVPKEQVGKTITVSVVAKATNYTNKTLTSSATSAIAKQDLAVTTTNYNVAYNGSEHYATIKVTSADWDGKTIVSGTSTSYGESVTTTGAVNTNYNLKPGYTAVTSAKTVYYKVTGGTYYNDKTGSATVTITQKKGTITLTNSSVSLTYKTSGSNTYTYDGDGAVSCSSGDTSYVTCSVDTTNHKINVVPVKKTSSAITITVSAGAGTNYSAADNKTFTVTVAAFTPTVSLTAKTDAQRTFTGSAIAANTATVTLTNSETYSGTINYTYYTNNACSTGATTTAPTSGTWYVKASIAASGNYNAASSGCINHTIIAATPTVSLSVKTGMTYNGSSQAANTATVSPNGGGTITYTYYTNNACSAGATTTAPTNAGNYWVKASVAEVSGKTNAASSSCVAHTISAKSVAVTWGTTTSFQYTGNAQAPTASATSGVTGETINVTRTTETNVGNYTSTASCSSVSGGQAKCSNYTLTGTTKAYSITEVAATCPTLTAYNKAYDGSAHGITVSGGSGGTIQYRTSTTGSWSNTAPTATNVSTTTVYVQVAGDGNHSDKDCGSSTITITRASVAEPNCTSATYNGSSQTMLAAKTSGAYTNSAITGTDAGSYSQTLTLNSNYQWSSGSNVTSNRTKTCTISAKSVAVTWGTTTSFAYTGSAQAPTASATSGVSGETINVTRTTETNVGNYTSTASCSSVSGGQAKCSNYTLTGTTKAYSITEVAATCPSLTAYNKAYDGSAHGITVSGGSGGTIQYRTSTTGSWSNTAPTATNVSTTTVYVQVAGDENHSDIDCGSSTITITRASVAEPSCTSATYNGSNQTLLAAKTSGAYTNSAITGTDAGSYSQTLTLNSNYQWSSGSNVTSNRTKTCTISAKSVAVTWGTTTSFAYTGSAQAPTASATSGVTGETINVTRTTETNVGNYTSTASCSSVSGGQAKCSNYTLTGTTKAYSITEVAATCPTLTAYNKAYDGSAHGITVSGGSGGTIQYRTSTTGSWSNTAPTATNVSTTTVYVQVAGDGNHSDKDCGSSTITITRASVAEPSCTARTYNGSSQTMLAAKTSGAYTNSAITGTDAGSYSQTLTLNSNYQWSSGSNVTSNRTKTCTISAKSVAVTWGTTTSFAYTGSAQAPTASATSGVTGETINVTRTTQTNVGSYTSTASCSSVSGGQAKCSNYTLTGTTKAYSITEVAATCPSLTAYNKAYDGSAHGITVSGGSGGTIQYRTSTTGSWSNTAPTATNVSTTTVYVQVAGDENHSDKDCGSSTITITKYTPTITLSTTTGTVNYNSTTTFTATPTVISACKGTLTATSANTTYVTITGGASTANATSAVTVTWEGAAYTTDTKINVNYATGDTTNCNNATQVQYTAKVNRINQTVSLTAKSATYSGSAIAANTATTTGNGSLSYVYYTNNTCTTQTGTTAATGGAASAGAAPKYVGTWYVKATAAQTGQYNSASSSCVTHTITKYTPTITLSATSGSVNENATATFTATPTVVAACKGTLTAASASTAYVTITGGASTTNATSAVTVTYKGIKYSTGTKINVNYATGDTSNCNNATQIQFTASVADKTAPTGSVSAEMNNLAISATASVNDAGIGLSGTYYWKVSTDSTCNSSTTGFVSNTSTTYTFNASSNAVYYVCLKVGDKSNNYGYFTTSVAPKVYLTDLSEYNTYYKNSQYLRNISSLKFANSINNTGAINSWDLSENKDNSIIGWLNTNSLNTSMYDLTIGSPYQIYAKNLTNTFANLSNLSTINLDGLHTAETISLYRMFYNVGSSSNTTNFSINFGNYFDTHNVIDMSYMFQDTAIYSDNATISLGQNFDAGNVTGDNLIGMFKNFGNRSNVVSIHLGNNFNASKVTNLYQMFIGTGLSAKQSLTINFGNNFNAANINTTVEMFRNFATSVPNIKIDFGNNFNAVKLTNVYWMFYMLGSSSKGNININLGKNFNASNLTSTNSMFHGLAYYGNENLHVTVDLGNNFNANKVIETQHMFYRVGGATFGDSCNIILGNNFNTSNVTNMSDMFDMACGGAKIPNIDFGTNFNTSNVTNMSSMFGGVCYGANNCTLTLPSKFNTSKVTSMSHMFGSFGERANSINLNLGSNFDTSNVTNMDSMFSSFGANNTTTLTLNLGTKFNTKKVQLMNYMFTRFGSNVTSLTLNLGSKFNTSNVISMYGMFDNAAKNSTTLNLNLGTMFNMGKADDYKAYIFRNLGNKVTSSFIVNIAGGTFNTYASNTGMFNGISPKAIIYVKDSTIQNWIISSNSRWGTNFSASNVLIR